MTLAPKTFDVHDLGIQWVIPEKNKQTEREDWRYGASRGINEIACRIFGD